MLAKNIKNIIKAEKSIIKAFCSTKSTQQANHKKNIQILQHELINNPEFDYAHPQFESKKPKTTLVKEEKNLDFLQSLGLTQRVNRELNQEEIIHQNFETYVEGYKSPQGPMKWMEESEKEKIHILIDQKLQQLENSCLSREEILYDDGRKGIPLSRDPFFQFIKSNKLAREMFIKPGQEFKVQKVVEIALRQDIGPDPSQARSAQKLPKTMELKDDSKLNVNADWDSLDPNQYFSKFSSKTKDYLKEFMKPDRKVHYMPMSEAEKRKKNQRKINYFDIHWRNTELLTEFMNAASNIKNKKQNRLTQNQQKKVSKAIKLAREMALLPYVGSIKPSDKMSLRTLKEDIDARTKMAINIQTGHIYAKGDESNNSQEKGEQAEDFELSIQGKMPEESEQMLVQAYLEAKSKKETQLLSQGVDTEHLKKENQKPTYGSSSLQSYGQQPLFPGSTGEPSELFYEAKNADKSQLQDSYQKIKDSINQRGVYDITSLLISERAFYMDQFQQKKSDNTEQQQQNISVEESLEILNKIRRLKNLEDVKFGL